MDSNVPHETLEDLEKEKLRKEINDLRLSPIKTIIGFIVAAATVIALIWGLFPGLDVAKERLYLDQSRLRLDQERLKVAASTLQDGFLKIFSEPSGLAVTEAVRTDKSPLFLVIDDEINIVALAEPVGGALVPTQNLSPKEFEKLDDLEAVTSVFDQNTNEWRYFIICSHRRFNDERESNIVRFGLRVDEKDPDLLDIVQKEVVRFSLGAGLRDYFMKNKELVTIQTIKDKEDRYTINDRKWWKKDSDNHPHQPFSLEIEAACVFGSSFYVGLKYPLSPHGHGIVLRYELPDIMQANKNDTPSPVGHVVVPLDGFGISAMTTHNDLILVAANPTGKDNEGGEYFNKSKLYVFKPTKKDNVKWERVGEAQSIARKGAKAEGIATLRDRLWIAYDGTDSCFDSVLLKSIALKNVKPSD